MRNGKLTTDQVLDVFGDELASRGGKITDTFNDGRRLFARSVLPFADEVRGGDNINGGIALKATDEQICVYPYTFRVICRNGAIRAESAGSLVIEGLAQLAPYFISQSLREGIDACCDPEIFKNTIKRMRDSAEMELDTALNLLPLFSRQKGLIGSDIFAKIVDRFFGERDKTQFGLGNAITSVARDSKDPEQRWNLEELGGGLLVAVLPQVPQDSGLAAELIPVA